MLYTLRFFSSKCSLFHNANLFRSCIIHILYTGCAKIKKNNSGAKGLRAASLIETCRGLLTKYINRKHCYLVGSYYTDISRCTVNKTLKLTGPVFLCPIIITPLPLFIIDRTTTATTLRSP